MGRRNEEKIVWVKKDAFVMPVLPKSLKVDPLAAALLHSIAFLELSGEETIDEDWSVEAMEHVGYYLDQLPAQRKEHLGKEVAKIAAYAKKKKWGKDAVEFFRDFMENFALDESDDDEDE